jgi:hypothetical protein
MEVYKRSCGNVPCGIFRWTRRQHISVSQFIRIYAHNSYLIRSVESSPMVGNAFTNSHNDWRTGTYEYFKDWAVTQFGLKDSESGDDSEVPLQYQKAKDIVFERNDDGELVLPPSDRLKTIRQKQRVIRGYIGAVYRK